MLGCKLQLALGLLEVITRPPVSMGMIVNRDGSEVVSVFLTRHGSPSLPDSDDYETGNFEPRLINVVVGHAVTSEALTEIIQAGWRSSTRLVDGLEVTFANFSAVMT